MKICPYCESGFHNSFDTCPVHGVMLSEIVDLRAGMLVRGTYRIVRKLGKGGMGAVYLAEQTLLGEPRALKFLSPELSADEAFIARFLHEVRTLRQVRNKHVVDCGDPEQAEDGSLFYSMEYVDGPNLREYLKTAARPFDVALGLEIVRGIALGLEAAHARGLVHRDIKPENVLLAFEDGHLVPKIADFGIVATKDDSRQTHNGTAMLTMAYAAPEQWMGTCSADLDSRTDIYALGGVLFEILTGETPFDAENYQAWAQKHMTSPPPVPSKYRPRLAYWRGLDAMILRMLAKRREDRQQNVAELLREIDAIGYVSGETQFLGAEYVPEEPSQTSAPPVPPAVPTPDAAPEPAPEPAPAPEQEAAWTDDEPKEYLTPTTQHPEVARPPDAWRTADPAAEAPIQNVEPVEAATAPPSVTTFHGKNNQAEDGPRTLSPLARRSATDGNVGTAQHSNRQTHGALAGVVKIALLLVALAGAGTGLHFWQQNSTPKTHFIVLERQKDAVVSIAYAYNGFSLAAASRDGTIQIWDTSEDKSTGYFKVFAEAVTFSPDGRTLASANDDQTVKLWDVAGGQLLATLSGHTNKVLAVSFSPDGQQVASGSADMTIRLWDVAADKQNQLLTGSTGEVRSVAYSPNGHMLVSGGTDNLVRLWDTDSVRLLRSLAGHVKAINAVAWSMDGKTVASASDDGTIRLWNAATGLQTRTLAGHTDAVKSLAFSRDGRLLLSGSSDGTARLWDLSTGGTAGTLNPGSGAISSVAFSPGGRLAATAGTDHMVRLWELATLSK